MGASQLRYEVKNMPANVYGSTTPTQSAPSSPGNLGGSTYEGGFSNSLASLPGIGGSLNTLLTSLYGSKPATANPVNTAAQAIKGNTSNLAANSNLTLGADTITAAGAQLPFELNLPGYNEMLSTATGNTQQELEGQVPQDVQNLLQQQGAERGVQTGQSTNSPDAEAGYLQALGLTSLGQEQQGQTNLSSLIGETPTGQAVNPANMFVTPEQQQAAAQYANTVAAAPDPEASGLLNTFESVI